MSAVTDTFLLFWGACFVGLLLCGLEQLARVAYEKGRERERLEARRVAFSACRASSTKEEARGAWRVVCRLFSPLE